MKKFWFWRMNPASAALSSSICAVPVMRVIEAGTGEALEMLQQHSDIRVALLDVMLPGIDGFEVCRRIRATNSLHRHHHAHRPLTGDGQGHGPDDRSGRLCH